MSAAFSDIAVADLTALAAAALGSRLAAFDGDRLIWRSQAFAADLPEMTEGRHIDIEDARLPGLPAALQAARDGQDETVLLAEPNGRRVYEARLAVRDGLVFVQLDDAAERQQAQRRHLADRENLLLTSRVLSVGEMATMIAHELNQPIGSITNVLRGLKARLERGALTRESGVEAIDRATDQALYASGVIQRVRTFVDQRQPHVQRLDLARLARATLDLLDWEIARDRVRADTDLPSDLPPVMGDQVMIQQVLVNLARNALDAMRTSDPDHRRLVIAAREDEDARQIELTLTDTGPGVPEEAAQRMFSPFFSTKNGGMGVGLGICRSIIELHSGRLWFTAAEGVGSVFHIALPLAPSDVVNPPREVAL